MPDTNLIIYQTDHLTIKPIDPNEYQEYYQLLQSNRTRLTRYFPVTIKKIKSPIHAQSHLKECIEKKDNAELYPFGIYHRQKLIGWISIKTIRWEQKECELGYYIGNEYEGKGIITTAIAQVTEFCFDALQMQKIFLRIGTDNHASQRVAEKNGFTQEKILKQEFKIETGELIDIYYYTKYKTP